MALIVRAEYQAWVNIVKEVKLEIQYKSETQRDNRSIGLFNDSFAYDPLDEAESQIRLILVHPGSFDDAMECTLIHTSIQNAKRLGFEAVSYCWGDSSIQTTINMEYNQTKYDLKVSNTIEKILRHLRRSDGQVRTLWIDAVSIDQNNYQERAQQVGLMVDIYSVAEAVNVWLGPSDRVTQLAFRVIRDIYNYSEHLCPGGAECSCSGTAHTMTREDYPIVDSNASDLHGKMDKITDFHWRRDPGYPEDQHLSGIMQSHYTLTSQLFQNPWFRRVWVLQEVINSKLSILRCGEDSIPWKELVEVISYTDQYVPHLEPLYRLPRIWSQLGKFRSPSLFPSGSNRGEEKLEATQEPGILDVVLEALELDATDPRDKLFALLSFGRETSSVNDLPELIRPNYNKSTDRVFTDFSRWWIMYHKSLRILSMVHGNPGRTWQGLHCSAVEPPATPRPSWTLGTEGMYSWTTATLDSQFEFRASGDSIPDVEIISNSFDSNPLHLHLLGFRLARIERLSCFPLELGKTADNASLFEVYEKIFEPTVSHGRWKSLRKQEDVSHSRGEIVRMLGEHHRAHWGYEPTQPLSLMKPNPARKNHASDYERYESNMALPCHGSCFFVATDGSIGLSPSAAKEGDYIAILLGGITPFLLREVGVDESKHYFEFVGECFVEGKMHGEFIREQESKGLRPEQLVLV